MDIWDGDRHHLAQLEQHWFYHKISCLDWTNRGGIIIFKRRISLYYCCFDCILLSKWLNLKWTDHASIYWCNGVLLVKALSMPRSLPASFILLTFLHQGFLYLDECLQCLWWLSSCQMQELQIIVSQWYLIVFFTGPILHNLLI